MGNVSPFFIGVQMLTVGVETPARFRLFYSLNFKNPRSSRDEEIQVEMMKVNSHYTTLRVARLPYRETSVSFHAWGGSIVPDIFVDPMVREDCDILRSLLTGHRS